jgi:hypothetical protein
LKIYQERMRALLDLPDQIDDDGRLVPRELVFSKEADDVMAAFEEEIEPDLAPGGRYERIGGAIGKLAGKAGRFAADLHVANYAGRSIPAEIPKETAAHAVRIARSTIPHTEALEDMLAAPPELLDARRIAAWLRRNGEPVVKDREILRGVRSIDQKARDTALRVLERHGLIRRPDGEPSRLGRPSPEWEVHPGWLTAEDDDALTLDDGDQAEAGA